MNAFPAYEYVPNYKQMMAVGGMTLRDYFAAKAMQGLFASGHYEGLVDPHRISATAFQVADAMMKAREA